LEESVDLPDMEKDRHFKATWTMNEEIQTEERNEIQYVILGLRPRGVLLMLTAFDENKY